MASRDEPCTVRRSAASLPATLLAVAVALSGSPHAAASPAAPAGWSGEPPLLAGTGRYDRGEWIYNDYVFDDYGADTLPASGQPNVVSLAPTVGDARYPVGEAYADNAADIAEVRVRRAGAGSEDLEVLVTLQTLVDADVPAIWVRADAAEHVFTSLNAAVDVGTNTIRFTLPGAAAGAEVDLVVGAGLHDGSGGLREGQPGTQQLVPDEPTTGAPTANRLFDLAFNSAVDEPRGGAWNEDAQSAALADGDLSAFVETIDLSALDDGDTTTVAMGPGYHVRLFPSHQGIPEGVRGSFPQYGGTLQPYAVWVPDGYQPGSPATLLLNLHSLSVHHNQYRGGTSPTYTTYYEQVGDVLDAIVVTPLGRGPDGWYLDEGFVDTLEVWADALATFPEVDPDRTLVSGYSMGGYGTYRLATLMPDSFASAVSVVGPPTNGIWTGLDLPADNPFFTYPQLENTRHVPFWITHGVLDELVPVAGVTRQAQRLAELGYEHRFALHPAEDHLTFTVKDSWGREAGWFAAHPERVERPAEVTLRVRPASLLSSGKEELEPLVADLLAEVGARVDGAYWVDDVVVAGADAGDVTGIVELTSECISRRAGAVTPVQSAGVDGPSPYALTGADVGEVDGTTNGVITGRLVDVASLTIDLERAGCHDVPILEIDADREVAVTLVRGGRPVAQEIVAPPASAPEPSPAASGGSQQLPATGGAVRLVPVIAALLGAAGLRRLARSDP